MFAAKRKFSKEHRILIALHNKEGCSNSELNRITQRFGSVIHRLRKDGHNITTVCIDNRSGYYKYYLSEEDK